jgi:ribosomal protein S18 acetylase RimI-like enzyme
MIRQATAADADAIGRLAAEFQAYLRSLGDTADFKWGAQEYLADGFGEHPAFEGLVEEFDSVVVAYALYPFGYDTDRGQRLVYLIDLFVSEPFRRLRIGEKLMDRVCDIGRRANAELVVWTVFRQNSAASRFYEKLGARHADDLYLMSLDLRTSGKDGPE